MRNCAARQLYTVILVAMCWCTACSRSPKETGFEVKVLNDMVDAVPAEAYAPNSVFADGKVMQTPVAGTVPRGFMPFPYGESDAEAGRAGRELANPFKPQRENIDRGRFVYDNFCAQCHGATGDGDGQLIPRYPNPPAFADRKLVAMPDGRLFHAITFGRKDMPPHASQLTGDDRWKVILYVRQLQESASPAATSIAPTVEFPDGGRPDKEAP